MTYLLKTLLHEYGILSVSLSKLEGERPGNPHESLNAYYESMGAPYEGPASVMREKIAALDPDEPKLVVGISADGSMKMRAFDENEPDSEGKPSGVKFLELPEDEFYFFKAFRHGLFEWEKQVPTFLLQMAFVHAYTLFENYLRSILSLRLTEQPELLAVFSICVDLRSVEGHTAEPVKTLSPDSGTGKRDCPYFQLTTRFPSWTSIRLWGACQDRET